jgi:hypothetical protein
MAAAKEAVKKKVLELKSQAQQVPGATPGAAAVPSLPAAPATAPQTPATPQPPAQPEAPAAKNQP